MTRRFTAVVRYHLLASLGVLAALTAVGVGPVRAADPIKVGFPIVLSGEGKVFGEPAFKGAQMYIDEINAQGGVLGRKIELIPEDTKSKADEAAKVSDDLIKQRGAQFLVGTISSSEGLSVSKVAKENKTIFLAIGPKTDQLTSPENLHPYVFRLAPSTRTEGRSAAALMSRWPVKRIATMAPDMAYGKDVVAAFVDRIKELRPEIEIVDQQWPKLSESDYVPFIKAQMAAKPEAVFSVICCGGFTPFAKQAKPLGYFESVNNRFLGVGEAASIEAIQQLGDDYPVGISGNTYDAFNWKGDEVAGDEHEKFIERLKTYFNQPYPPSWPIQGYIGMLALVEGIKKAGSVESEKVIKALSDLDINTPHGLLTIRGSDHQLNRGSLWGPTIKDPKYPFPIVSPIEYIDPTNFMD